MAFQIDCAFFLGLRITSNINYFVPTNMDKLTETYKFRCTKTQISTLQKLDSLGVCPSKFIRLAIKEKLNKDYNQLVHEKKLSLKTLKQLYPNIF